MPDLRERNQPNKVADMKHREWLELLGSDSIAPETLPAAIALGRQLAHIVERSRVNISRADPLPLSHPAFDHPILLDVARAIWFTSMPRRLASIAGPVATPTIVAATEVGLEAASDFGWINIGERGDVQTYSRTPVCGQELSRFLATHQRAVSILRHNYGHPHDAERFDAFSSPPPGSTASLRENTYAAYVTADVEYLLSIKDAPGYLERHLPLTAAMHLLDALPAIAERATMNSEYGELWRKTLLELPAVLAGVSELGGRSALAKVGRVIDVLPVRLARIAEGEVTLEPPAPSGP